MSAKLYSFPSFPVLSPTFEPIVSVTLNTRVHTHRHTEMTTHTFNYKGQRNLATHTLMVFEHKMRSCRSKQSGTWHCACSRGDLHATIETWHTVTPKRLDRHWPAAIYSFTGCCWVNICGGNQSPNTHVVLLHICDLIRSYKIYCKSNPERSTVKISVGHWDSAQTINLRDKGDVRSGLENS